MQSVGTEQADLTVPITYMKKMVGSANHFALVDKEIYHNHIVRKKYLAIRKEEDDAYAWPWRVSKGASASTMKGVIFRQYQRWAEKINLEMIRVQVSLTTLTMILVYPPIRFAGREFALSRQSNHHE